MENPGYIRSKSFALLSSVKKWRFKFTKFQFCLFLRGYKTFFPHIEGRTPAKDVRE